MSSVDIRMMWEAGADTALGLPRYETLGAAGADLRANLPDQAAITLDVCARALVPTGLRLAIRGSDQAAVGSCAQARDHAAEQSGHN